MYDVGQVYEPFQSTMPDATDAGRTIAAEVIQIGKAKSRPA